MAKGYRTGGMKKGFIYKRKKLWYTDGKIETQIFDGNPIPDGFIRGRLKFNKPAWNSGLTKNNDERIKKISDSMLKNIADNGKRRWITNGEENKLILESDDIPKTFWLGRTFKNERHFPFRDPDRNLDEIFETISINEFREFWAISTSAEVQKRFKLRRSEMDLIINELNLEPYRKHSCNIFGKRMKGRNTWSKGYKHTDEAKKHMSDAQKRKSPEDYIIQKQKENFTRKLKGSYLKHITKSEELVWGILKNYFDDSDIIYQYFDPLRYPFDCDFYIKSIDLFIEVNIYPSHGGRLFTNSAEDNLKLKEWLLKKTSGHKQYDNWIYTWTNLDVRKNILAKTNNLNYICLYKEPSREELYEIIKNKIN